MFEDLLNGIFDRNELYDTKAKAQYLSELRHDAKQLWQLYRRQDVTVDYSEAKIQEVSNVSAYGTS